MSEPNDDLGCLQRNVREQAEDGLSLLVQWALSGSDIDKQLYRDWACRSQGWDRDAMRHEPSFVLGQVLASLPKGTSLCIK